MIHFYILLPSFTQFCSGCTRLNLDLDVVVDVVVVARGGQVTSAGLAAARAADFDPTVDVLLVSKSLTLTGQYPFVEAARSFLFNIYRSARPPSLVTEFSFPV